MSARGVAQCRPRIIHARVAMTDAVDADLERERAFDRALSAVPADVRARVVEATEEEREARERVEASERHHRRGSDSFAAFDELGVRQTHDVMASSKRRCRASSGSLPRSL